MIRTLGGYVNTWDIDEMGHLNVSHYVDRFTHANAHMAEALGHGVAVARSTGVKLTAKTDQVMFARELRNASSMEIHSGVIKIDNEAITLFHRMRNVMTGEMSASCITELGLRDLDTGASHTLAADIQDRAAKLVTRPDDKELPRSQPMFAFDGAPSLENADRLGLFETSKSIIEPMECDWTGALRPRFIMGRYSDGASHMWRSLDLLGDIENTRIGSAVVQIHLAYGAPARAGDGAVVRSNAWNVGAKSLNFINWQFNTVTGDPFAVANTVVVLFDTKARKAVPVSDEMRAAVASKIVDPQS